MIFNEKQKRRNKNKLVQSTTISVMLNLLNKNPNYICIDIKPNLACHAIDMV
jgi:hypothetical protein